MIQVLPRTNFQNLPKEPDIGNKMSMSAFFSLCASGNQKTALNTVKYLSNKSKKSKQKYNTSQRKPNKKFNKTDNTCSSSSSGVDMAEIMSKSPSCESTVRNKKAEQSFKTFDTNKVKSKNAYKNKHSNKPKRYYDADTKDSDTYSDKRQYVNYKYGKPTQFKSFNKSNSYPQNRNHSRCTVDSTSSYTGHSDSGVSSGHSTSVNNIYQAQYNPKQAYNFNNNSEYYHNQTVQCNRTKVRVATLHESPDEGSSDTSDLNDSLSINSNIDVTQLKNNQQNYNKQLSNTSKDSSSSLGFDDLTLHNPRYAGLAAAPEPLTLPDPPFEWLSFSQKTKKKKSNKLINDKNDSTGGGNCEKFNIINNTAKSDLESLKNCVKETNNCVESSINKIAT